MAETKDLWAGEQRNGERDNDPGYSVFQRLPPNIDDDEKEEDEDRGEKMI